MTLFDRTRSGAITLDTLKEYRAEFGGTAGLAKSYYCDGAMLIIDNA